MFLPEMNVSNLKLNLACGTIKLVANIICISPCAMVVSILSTIRIECRLNLNNFRYRKGG